MKKFGQQLKVKRIRLNLTQSQVAEIFSISRGYYSQIEASKKYPGFRLLFEMLHWIDKK